MTSTRSFTARLTGALLCAALAGCGVSSQDEPQRIEQPPQPSNTPSVTSDRPSPTTTTTTSATTTPSTQSTTSP